jgi:Glycosyl hydrolase catalytic core
MDIALPALEARDYVIRYAWFSGNKKDFPALANASLWDETTKDLTSNGKYYFNKY